MLSYEMFPLIFMGIEMILFDNSVLKLYLLNTHLSFHIKYGTALTTILPILFLYLNIVTVTAGTFEP